MVAEEVPLDFDQHLPGASATVRTEIEVDVQEGAIVGLLGPTGESLTFYRNEQGQPMTARLKTVHEGKDGGQVRFDFEDESSGTRRLMEILPILADVGTRERVYVVDELEYVNCIPICRGSLFPPSSIAAVRISGVSSCSPPMTLT